jgi:hypothetical protein
LRTPFLSSRLLSGPEKRDYSETAEEGEGGVELDKEDVPNEEDNYPLDAFEILARRRPGIDLDLPLMDSLDTLGDRDLDYNYDWSLHVGKYNVPL